MLLAAALVFELSRESLTGAHYRYREYVNGLPTDNYTTRTEFLGVPRVPRRGFDDAVLPSEELRGTPRNPEELRIVAGRVIRREIVSDHPLEPYAHDYDAVTGVLLRRTPLFFHAKPARVFDPNPVVTLNDPALQDRNDSASAVPAAAYKDVTLDDAALHGPHVTLVDRQPRSITPPEGPLVFDREQDGFEDVNAYFHIDRSQRHLQALGYTGARAVVPYAIEVDAHAASGADNSFFVPSTTEAGKGVLYFGEGGTDDAEDADLLVHEYAHAIHEWIAPGTFGGPFSGEARALGEGLGDYWAFSAHADARRASGRDPYCFADWDARCWQDAPSENCGYAAGSDCLRRLDSTKTMADYDTSETSGVEHRNGAIWASALREIHERVGRTVADTIVIESLFGTPPRPTFAVMAERLLQADRLLYRGAHAGAICSAMFTRGIVTRCDTTPRGERSLFQSTAYGVAIPENSSTGVTSAIVIDDPRAIEELSVRVDIDHPSRGDLFVELTAPDGTKVLLHQLSSSRTPDIHTTFPLDAFAGRSAAGTWTLFVADRRPRDAGTLQSWGLEIRFAGDGPVTERPRSAQSQVIPVVAHVFGQDGAYISDVRIANPSDAPRTATLIFTRSGEDTFAVQRLVLEAGQTVALDDVVERTFHTFGSGTLEIQGDVIAMSRMAGQQVPPARDTTALRETSLLVAAYPDPATRVNFGLAETGGGRGIVRVNGRDVPVTPFGHVQFPAGHELLEVSVVEGDARVAAYVSQIGADAMYIAAESSRQPGCAPAITSQLSGQPEWRSDLWIASPNLDVANIGASPGGDVNVTIAGAYEDVLARLFHRTVTIAELCVIATPRSFVSTRIVHGATTQAVPMAPFPAADAQHFLFVENSAAYRTNIGFSGAGGLASVTIYDAAGAVVERFSLFTDLSGGVVQREVRSPVTNGRAVVQFALGTGRAYASVIDRRTGDATFFPAQ
ncbi:MAG TPA: proprotein convertase P-domain-containing protein [Thermoanaerobaculia bacterium]